MLFNWVPIMATLEMTLAIAIMAIMAILAIMATMAMADGSYKVAITGIQLKSTKKLANWR